MPLNFKPDKSSAETRNGKANQGAPEVRSVADVSKNRANLYVLLATVLTVSGCLLPEYERFKGLGDAGYTTQQQKDAGSDTHQKKDACADAQHPVKPTVTPTNVDAGNNNLSNKPGAGAAGPFNQKRERYCKGRNNVCWKDDIGKEKCIPMADVCQNLPQKGKTYCKNGNKCWKGNGGKERCYNPPIQCREKKPGLKI
jgi:hypothetical protein